MTNDIIKIENLRRDFKVGSETVHALRGISFSIRAGEFVTIMGTSGSGKSTLLNILGCLDTPTSGDYYLDGIAARDMGKNDRATLRNRKIGFVFQSYNLIPNLTVKENIETGAYLSNDPLPLDDMLKTLGLWEHKDKIPNQLSGGQQQRTAIGRAIIKNPDILLCDEPTGALDYKTSKEILKLIETVNQKFGNTVILVTHNDAIRHMADQVIKLHDGQIRHNDKNEQKIPAVDLDW